MKKLIASLFIVLSVFSTTGCTDMNNQNVGTLSGGVLGGLVGSRFGGGGGQLVAIGAGTLLGAYLGGSMGKNMDDADKAKMNNALENNTVGQPAYWHNPNTGANYHVTPVKNVSVHGNQYCREYRTTANIAGKEQQVYGTACRKPDGSWKVVK
jgi:surface antigen